MKSAKVCRNILLKLFFAVFLFFTGIFAYSIPIEPNYVLPGILPLVIGIAFM